MWLRKDLKLIRKMLLGRGKICLVYISNSKTRFWRSITMEQDGFFKWNIWCVKCLSFLTLYFSSFWRRTNSSADYQNGLEDGIKNYNPILQMFLRWLLSESRSCKFDSILPNRFFFTINQQKKRLQIVITWLQEIEI